MGFSLIRMSKLDELQRHGNELKEQTKILTSEVEKLRLEIAELRKESKNSTREISQLQEEANKMPFQKEELANSI